MVFFSLVGEELTIPYLDTSLGTAARRRHLLEAYGFYCNCMRCKETDNEE